MSKNLEYFSTRTMSEMLTVGFEESNIHTLSGRITDYKELILKECVNYGVLFCIEHGELFLRPNISISDIMSKNLINIQGKRYYKDSTFFNNSFFTSTSNGFYKGTEVDFTGWRNLNALIMKELRYSIFNSIYTKKNEIKNIISEKIKKEYYTSTIDDYVDLYEKIKKESLDFTSPCYYNKNRDWVNVTISGLKDEFEVKKFCSVINELSFGEELKEALSTVFLKIEKEIEILNKINPEKYGVNKKDHNYKQKIEALNKLSRD